MSLNESMKMCVVNCCLAEEYCTFERWRGKRISGRIDSRLGHDEFFAVSFSYSFCVLEVFWFVNVCDFIDGLEERGNLIFLSLKLQDVQS